MYRPGDSLVVEFIVLATTGAAVDADALPTGLLARNGIDDATSVTITHVDTGRYRASCTIPSGWSEGDTIAIVASSIVSGVATKAVPFHDVLRTTFAQWFTEFLEATVPMTNAAGTVGDSLNAARAGAFGKLVLSGTQLQLFGSDDFTPVKTFTLNSGASPTQRA